VLLNLAPRAIRGVDSEGMILMTETNDGRFIFVNPSDPEVANGLAIS
jgi:methionyl-tRNA synthetase